MAGNYAAYRAQPTLPTNDDGSDALKRMAERSYQDKLDRRAEQQRLASAGEEAINLAIEAGKVDVNTIDSSVHGMLAKRLDAYQEEMVRAQDAIAQNPSFKNRTTLQEVKNKFTNDISSIKGVGQIIRETSDPSKYDNVLAVEGLNGISKFILDIPNLANKYNAVNGTIDGKSLNTVMSEYFDPSKLIAPVDVDKSISDYVDVVFEGIEPQETVDINGNIIRSTKQLEYDEAKARNSFMETFENTHDYTKKSHQLLQEYYKPDQQAKMEKYVTHNADGSVDVTMDNFYQFVKDTELDKRARKNVTEKGYIDRTAQAAAPRKTTAQVADDEENDRLYERITKLVNNEAVDLTQMTINVDGVKRQIEDGKTEFDPVSGKEVVKIYYSVIDKAGNKSVETTTFDADNAAQAIGTSIKPSFDYNGELIKKQEVDPSIQKPVKKLTTEEKSADIKARVSKGSQALLGRINEKGNDEDGVVEVVQEWINKEGDMNQSFIDFVNDNFKVAWSLGNKVNFGRDGFMDYDVSSADDRENLTQDLVAMNIYAKQLQSKGINPDEITQKLTTFAKKSVRNERLELNPDLQSDSDKTRLMSFLRETYPEATDEALESVYSQGKSQNMSVDEMIKDINKDLRK